MRAALFIRQLCAGNGARTRRADEMAREIPEDKENLSLSARYALARALAGENGE